MNQFEGVHLSFLKLLICPHITFHASMIPSVKNAIVVGRPIKFIFHFHIHGLVVQETRMKMWLANGYKMDDRSVLRCGP